MGRRSGERASLETWLWKEAGVFKIGLTAVEVPAAALASWVEDDADVAAASGDDTVEW